MNGISIDKLSNWVSSANSWRIGVGFSGCSATMLLLAGSVWVPEGWIPWVQWPIYGTFLIFCGALVSGAFISPNQDLAKGAAIHRQDGA